MEICWKRKVTAFQWGNLIEVHDKQKMEDQ
jgi:hypothetical protein